ncbi:uncharacterized protein LOC124999214 [Mugil cephalus]|uniref:uncharacterized protein LOC124999214 n=1 Tax=Mugil cephalus TaxID=48193 RepID=UPI001FB841FC|nr:uncharacterized protein LOC124999214 [Mugil cephalus]
MDKITLDNVSPQARKELTPPLSPKRPRTDCTVLNEHGGKSKFDFPELLRFQKTISSPSSPSTLHKNEGAIGTAECGFFKDEKPQEQPQDPKVNVTYITEVTPSHCDSAYRELPTVHFITAERHRLLLEEDEQPPVTETDKNSSYPGGATSGSLAECPASASADTPSHPDGKQLGKSLENKIPGGFCLSAGNEDERQVPNYFNQIQAAIFGSRNEEVRCLSDCISKDENTGFCPWSQYAVETNQRGKELEVSENIVFSKEDGESPLSSSDYADPELPCTHPKEESSGNLAEGEKNELELQICVNGSVFVCDGETIGQVNESDIGKTFFPAAECAEGSILSNDVVLDRNIANGNASLEVDGLYEAKGEHAAGRIITEAGSETADHTTETPMLTRISQEPAEGDNDAGPFTVIDPAIWSETDRDAEEKRRNSGVELSASVKVSEMETPFCSDERPSLKVSSPDETEQFNHRGSTLCEGEHVEFSRSQKEPHACSVTTNQTHNMNCNGGNCQWQGSHSSTNPFPAGDDERQERHDAVECQLKGEGQSSCFPVNFDHLKTQEVEYSHSETDRMGETFDTREIQESKIKRDEHANLEKAVRSSESIQHQNEQHQDNKTEISTDDCVSDSTEGEMHEKDGELTLTEGQVEIQLECLSDHVFSADVSMIDVTVEGKASKEMSTIGEEIQNSENSKILSKYEDDVQNENEEDMTDVSPVEYMSECTEGNMLTHCPEDDQEHKLMCFSDLQHGAENMHGLLAAIFPPTSDAVVPCQRDLSHSQNAHSPTAPICSDRFPPLPSAFSLYNSVPGAFDNFEKIQLSPDDDDDAAAGSSDIPVLSSLSSLLLKTPQRQVLRRTPAAESDKREEIPGKEEEEERFERHSGNVADGFVGSDSCNDAPNFISATDGSALRRPARQASYEPARDSSERIQDQLNPQSVSSPDSDSPTSAGNDRSEFVMKKQFDMVLKELNLFFEISRSDNASDSRPSSPEHCSAMAQPQGIASKCKEDLSSPDLGLHSDTTADDADEDHHLQMCEGVPVVACAAVSGGREQEVPRNTHMHQEASEDAAEKHRGPRETEQKGKAWSPSFLDLSLMEQANRRVPEQPKRLEPLKTCTRPIRVGLSKRAKTKHLHRPHPYK